MAVERSHRADVPRGPRIALIHALRQSIAPIHAEFAHSWPEAETFDLFDSSLARDLARAGSVDDAMIERFMTLGRYAASTWGEGGTTAALLFTCSAFGPAIDAVKAALPVPVLRPNEAAFDRALSIGGHVGLLVTFEPSLRALEVELQVMARSRRVDIDITARVVEGALAALRSGYPEEHDRLVAAAAAAMPRTDSLILGQFSLAHAADAIRPIDGCEILTTPRSAVERLRTIVAST